MAGANRVALVTGAGSGIGRACARALLDEGWDVVVAGRRLGVLEESIAPWPDHGLAVPCDVTQDRSVTALFDNILQRFGRLDLLFNNAGIASGPKLPDELALADWRRVVDTNLNGAFFCLAAAFKLMRSQTPRGGRIINNGSLSAYVPRPMSIAYTATKHAMTGLTRAAALDGREFDIAVGQIDIGNAATELSSRMAGMPRADGSHGSEARMDLSAVAQTFMTMVNLPLSSNVLFMTVMATQMPFVGRG